MIAVLFARADSVYKTLPELDVYDITRNAKTWTGGGPCIAHPPCRSWGKFAWRAKPREGEKELAPWAVDQVRLWGGVLEHPESSRLWAHVGITNRVSADDLDTVLCPGNTQAKDVPGHSVVFDEWGGWLLVVDQHRWGHRARKMTGLYIVGCPPNDLPQLPPSRGEPTHVIGDCGRSQDGTRKPEVSKQEREATPPDFAQWLVELANRCRGTHPGHWKNPRVQSSLHKGKFCP